jgi:hypothetical protein
MLKIRSNEGLASSGISRCPGGVGRQKENAFCASASPGTFNSRSTSSVRLLKLGMRQGIETPAPQRNTTCPLSRAASRRSGMFGPFERNLKLFILQKKIVHTTQTFTISCADAGSQAHILRPTPRVDPNSGCRPRHLCGGSALARSPSGVRAQYKSFRLSLLL